MKTKIYLLVILILFLTIGCNSPESKIKKDLKSRYTGFEIVEIQKESSNVWNAMMNILSLKIRTSEANAKISKGLLDIEEGTKSLYKPFYPLTRFIRKC